jgi:amino acid adenylation domain-containing protein
VDFNRFEFTDKEIEAILGAWKGSLQRAAETMDIRSVDLVATQVTERIGNAVLVDRRSQLPRLLDWVEDQMGRLGSGQVKEADRTLELSEINRSANRFSRQLQALGCEIGDRVVIALPRCASFIVSMLAILKAGGTYVPVDIYSPVERLRKVFEDCGARLVVTSQDLRQSLCDIGATVLEFDEHSFRTFGDQRLDLDRPQEAAAYILFTSGSTGSPKGVEISDTSLLNQLRWFISEFDLTGTDRYLHRTATCFDASVWEIWVPLLTGGTIVIHQQQRSLDLEEILRILVDEEITVVQFTPSLLRLAAGLDSFAAATSLRYLFCGGEVLQPELAASVQRTINATLVNLYGPTETCVQVLFHKVDSNVTYRTIPLGKEIDNCVVDIVDPDSRQRLKVGAIGELWIRGLPVFRGYVNRPEETARAIGSLSSNNSRWYRSGDVCRKLVDGSFECLGRRDNQVKLRGFRVELDEVSAQISRITEGRNVATLCIDGAYLVSFVESETVVQGLLDELADRVPDYMIPTSIYFRSSLPRSASGKIDTQALRLLLQTLQRSKSPLTSETEKAVARIWADVLALENIGADDDFFAIGGDSIRSVEIVYSARRSGLVFTVLDLFDYRTPRRLAEAIDHGQINPAVTDAVAPNDSPTIHSSQVDAYPATSMQRYMIERYREDSQRTGVFHAQQVLTITGLRLSLELLQAAIDRLCSAINFRTRFAYHQGKLFQIVVDRHVLTIQEHDLSDLSDHAQREQREHICAADLEHAFDPLAVDEPLVRFILIKYGEAHHELVVSNHHAIQDGWGNHYFLQCLLKDYGRQAAGDDRHMVYDETTNDCKTFVFLEERCANDPASLEFWRSQVCEDNRARRSERMTGTYWKELERTLDERTRRALAEVRESGGVSYKAIFLSAYSYILTHNASTSDDWIGVVSNGRCEQLNNPTEAMGLFWTMLPFRYPTRSAGTKGPDVALAQDWLEKTERYRAFPVRNIFELSGTSDLFDATFNYIRFPNIQTDSTKLNGRVVASRAFDHFGMPLQLSVSETASVDFTIHLRYAADVWSRGDIEILWSQLMGAIAEVKASEKKRSSLLGTDG